MNITNAAIAGLILLTISGCASRQQHQVIIDPKGVDMARYQQDLAECQQLAAQVQQKAGGGAVAGAIVGGLVGAAVGNSRTAERMAGAGAVVGGAGGAGDTARERDQVVKNCMRGRGYRVLN